MTFKNVFDTYTWNEVKQSIYQKTEQDVWNALAKQPCDIEDFKALISPAALPYLEQMAQRSHQITKKRFGNTMQLYVPLYLSNACTNICTYCGFSLDNKIPRKTLTDREIIREIDAIKKMGYEHVLLVTGESQHHAGVDYLQNAIKLVHPHFANIAMEVQPLDCADYQLLCREGLHTVLVYQETYHKDHYKKHHPKGKKANFDYRLETPDRLGQAQMHKIGLGILLGLEDWRTDSFFTALHLSYLEKKYWQTKYSLSFPRLRPHAGTVQTQSNMNDRELIQLLCAYRLFNHEVELSLSTRESEKFRNNAIKLGITSLSAASKTNPGGYANETDSLEQFEINDQRSVPEIVQMLRQQGYEPVWKDWEKF